MLDAIMAEAIKAVFEEYVDKHSLAEIGEIFAKGVKIEVGDMLPSAAYAELLKRVPPVWDTRVRGERVGRRRHPGLLRGIRARRVVRPGPYLAVGTPWADRVRF